MGALTENQQRQKTSAEQFIDSQHCRRRRRRHRRRCRRCR